MASTACRRDASTAPMDGLGAALMLPIVDAGRSGATGSPNASEDASGPTMPNRRINAALAAFSLPSRLPRRSQALEAGFPKSRRPLARP